jgi:3-ketosteroid 9alpha-monooxygenase subunit B
VEKELAPSTTASTHALRVAKVVRETADACSIVFEIPEALVVAFRYRAGQFVTLHVPYGGKILPRCYSLASSPDCEVEHKITIKRIAGGRISNWINDNVKAGDVLQCLPPGGLFVLHEGVNDLVLFAGGSGITPVISLVKTALVKTSRRVRLVYANRNVVSVIFRAELDALAAGHPGRLEIVYRYDDSDGFVDVPHVREWAADRRGAEFYVCGPAEFMTIVERALLEEGVAAEHIHIERFFSPSDPDEKPTTEAVAPAASAVGGPASIAVHLDGKRHDVPYTDGQTVLVACQGAGLRPPFSCTEAFCGCCMAKLVSGQVRMKHNDFLSKKEVAQGWVLTCQSIPLTADVEIRYPE